MKRYGFMLFLSASVVLIPLFASAGNDTKAFVGTWEYRQRAGAGYDQEGERIEILGKGRSPDGTYFGLEREGEHGLFYTAVELKDLKLIQGRIYFTVPDRHLFNIRPKSVKEAKQNESKSSGYSREELHMEGRMKGGSLMVTCTSEAGSCPDTVMEFRKNKWDKK